MFDAIYRGDCERVRALLSQGTPATVKGGNGETALDYAASHGRDACVEALLEYGAVYETLPMETAAVSGDPAVMRRFLRMGGDPNAMDKDGRTLLMEAAYRGNANTVALLLQQGADPHKKSPDGHTALDAAALYDGPQEVRDDLLSLLKGERYAMFDAIYREDCDKLKDLLSQGYSPNARNLSETAFVYPASHGRDACVEALLEHGAKYKELPIVDAAVPRDPTVMERLLQMGDPSKAVLQAALMEAAFYGNADTVRLLLAHGADPREETAPGHSVFDAPEQWDCTP